MKPTKRILAIAGSATALMLLAACPGETGQSHEQKNTAAQQRGMTHATQQVPVPENKHFLARKALAEYMRRMDTPEKIWYVYELADTGAMLGYWVARTYPQSICTFMSPPERVKEHMVSGQGSNPISVTTAPALDGVYYKGGGCETKFFFDAATDAMILTDMKIRALDVPLTGLDVEPFQVEVVQAEAAN